MDVAFDEFGDEFDCRKKSLHSQGNIGKATWVSVGEHRYTGMFKGADTGFVRLSTTTGVVPFEQADAKGGLVMNPTIALKFLRDGIDSANAFGNMNVIGGSTYNWFENSLHSNLREGGALHEHIFDNPIMLKSMPATNFVTAVGHSEFASFD